MKHYLVAHAGNKYKPLLLAKESVAVIVLILFLVEGVYFFGTQAVLHNTGFTAAVLPAALTDLTNSDRLARGREALTPDPLLAKAAQRKAEDMASKGYFAHVSPDGKTPWYWLDFVGYKYTYAGENLAINFTDSINVEEAWMNSPEHHANIVKPEYTQIGIGTAQGMYQGAETTFVVELFATLPETSVAQAVPQKETAAVATTKSAPSTPKESDVLGAQVAPTRIPVASSAAVPSVATAVSSPNHILQWALVVFAIFIAALLALAIFAKVSVVNLEIIAGGAVLIGIALGLVFFNGSRVLDVKLPSDGQSASVSLAL